MLEDKKILKGTFNNCYGIKSLDNFHMDYSKTNKGLIYAPNGVMKTSLTRVFENISKGIETEDRIFRNNSSIYDIRYHNYHYTLNVNGQDNKLEKTENIYVINSFADDFQFTKETVSTLLADEKTRKKYGEIMVRLKSAIDTIEEELRKLSNITKPKLKDTIVQDLGLSNEAEWSDIIIKINGLKTNNILDMQGIKYARLFHQKAVSIYQTEGFLEIIDDYLKELNIVLNSSEILSPKFHDKNMEELGKGISKSEIFSAGHSIVLKDERKISTMEEWEDIVGAELEKIYKNPSLKKGFDQLKKTLNANADAENAKKILMSRRDLIQYLGDLNKFKRDTWVSYFETIESTVKEKIIDASQELIDLHKEANEQADAWVSVVSEFNRRFRVPFTVKITNKSNFLLRGDAPNITFEYTRGKGPNIETADMSKDNIMKSLSMGERRALYLLYILFDLEKLKEKAKNEKDRYLIVADDVADSFDYKNKYAIVEYLQSIARCEGFDLLILTHNYDFFRIIKSRLEVETMNCLMAQRDQDDNVTLMKHTYQEDFFKQHFMNRLNSKKLTDEERYKLIIASIPFYRNISDYTCNGDTKSKLTCYLHMKLDPITTEEMMISDVWELIKGYIGDIDYKYTDANYLDTIFEISDKLSVGGSEGEGIDETNLINKLVLSMAIRLKAEKFLKPILIENNIQLIEKGNQTRGWFEKAKKYLSDEKIAIIDRVQLITPENIHLNSFMFEPLIDMSAWALQDLYKDVTRISEIED